MFNLHMNNIAAIVVIDRQTHTPTAAPPHVCTSRINKCVYVCLEVQGAAVVYPTLQVTSVLPFMESKRLPISTVATKST